MEEQDRRAHVQTGFALIQQAVLPQTTSRQEHLTLATGVLLGVRRHCVTPDEVQRWGDLAAGLLYAWAAPVCATIHDTPDGTRTR